jgi:hypothetical protein
VLVSVDERYVDVLLQRASDAGVPVRLIGTTGGSRIRIRLDGEVTLDLDVGEAEQAWRSGIEQYFARQVA